MLFIAFQERKTANSLSIYALKLKLMATSSYDIENQSAGDGSNIKISSWPHSLFAYNFNSAVFQTAHLWRTTKRLWITRPPGGWATWPKYAQSSASNASSTDTAVWGRTFQALLGCSCLHKYLLTHIHAAPANPRRYFCFQQTQEREKGTWWRGGGAVGVTVSNAPSTRANFL